MKKIFLLTLAFFVLHPDISQCETDKKKFFPLAVKLIDFHKSRGSYESIAFEELLKKRIIDERTYEDIKNLRIESYSLKREDGAYDIFMFWIHYPGRSVGFEINLTPEPEFDTSLEDPEKKSSDLKADKRLMWETVPLRRNEGMASSRGAVWAASRVFNSLELIGLSEQEVIKEIGDPKTSSDSIYNFPFWQVPGNSIVYRFDTGSYGWQFNLILGRCCTSSDELYS
ncbi:MAG: hypothetical protein GY795_20145 [Desulfobacterales bacterium]|nr:hypothetical protein [Desulfobacterales bacterium]